MLAVQIANPSRFPLVGPRNLVLMQCTKLALEPSTLAENIWFLIDGNMNSVLHARVEIITFYLVQTGRI